MKAEFQIDMAAKRIVLQMWIRSMQNIDLTMLISSDWFASKDTLQ